jgi:HEAT repeats
MPFLILAILIAIGIVWYYTSQRGLSANERQYLRRRGYHTDEEIPGPPVPKDTRLFNLIASLSDLSPYARQKAAEDLARMCQSGQRDPRMFSALIAALDDRDANVRSAAANALASLAMPEAVEPLHQRLNIEESIQTRASIQRAIEKLGGRKEDAGA